MSPTDIQIPEDKREKIYQAALKEFAEKGYEKASTNQIIQSAGISKGLLFHYFKNKKNLFLYIFEVCLETFTKLVLDQAKDLPSDLFERLLLIAKIKIKLSLKHPMEYKFLFSSLYEIPAELKPDIDEKIKHLDTLRHSLLFSGLDRSRFRPDINQDQVIHTLIFFLEALGNRYVSQLQAQADKGLSQMEAIYKEFIGIIDLLKYGVYKSEEKKEKQT
ncbi:TetR/AcrR family transcriptional regulator [Thermoflavimicrobium dichotomicum]|uniref:DNA-binding transcriptional regulator, AcrR family n=1 Tax=Thermoflavimicrobium dichotomicum TaxID=46223 RepID=A0A1I3T186_9BACL|nr:TetR/AcrR family transcriptional regulator [Thermoflavimicrobium dichotomicum]SFJ64262.1 DNA-binding transcriptional regulator, AcrR family [Thermoflavimicrobium dichotomicum]